MTPAGPDNPTARARRRWWLWFLLAGLAVVGAVPLLPAAGQEAARLAVGVAGSVAVAVGLRLHRPARPLAWQLLCAGLSVATLANVVWAAAGILGVTVPDLSVVDLLYCLTYPLLTVGLAILPVHGRYATPLAGMAEAGIVACTAAVLSWAVLIGPLLTGRQLGPLLVSVLPYPLFDLLLLAMAARMAIVTGSRAPAHLMVTGAIAALLVADSLYVLSVADSGSWSPSPLSLAGWLVAYVLNGAAALHPSMAAQARAPAAPTRPTSAGALAGSVVLVVLGPVATAWSLLREPAGRLHPLDIVVPLAATTLTAVLLVVRLADITRLARRRAADLDIRTIDLEGALVRQAALQDELAYQALHDPLTGLPNRALLDQRLAQALGSGAVGALLMLDLDGFKNINDRFGHPTGDAFLVAVAHRLSEVLGPGDLLARLGGDEFAVLVRHATASAVAVRGEAVLAALRRPVEIDGHQLYASASVGVRALDPALGSAGVLRDADLALYAAKAAGKDNVVEYDERLRAEHLDHSRMVERLRGAAAGDELEVHYQPVVRLADNACVAVEALVRWQPAGEATVGPDRFIEVAEDSGLIVPLGEWVLRRACRDAAVWFRRHGVRLAVNVSPRQLREPDFAAVVRRALDESGLPASALTLEITETVLVGTRPQAEQAVAHLTALRQLGVRVAVDDFGTGYSSLAYLRDLPIDALKIDRSFLPTDGADAHQRTVLVRAIVDLAASLGLRTVAEGVETAAQAAVLRAMGCHHGQGYHFAAPAPAAHIATVLAGARLAENAQRP